MLEERVYHDTIENIPAPPQNETLVGHGAARERLNAAWRGGRLHHAWLLSGPQGIGKATFAFAAARGLLSQQPEPEADLFNATDPRTAGQVASGAHPNLLHLTRPFDEKAKRFKTVLSIDEIRRTQNFYGMTAGADGWRICIVDAADDMNGPAANALLKILEEPPKRSLFFVITHSPGRLLPTIRSRCQALSMKPLDEGELLTALSALNVPVSSDARGRIAALSGGSVRRAIQVLQGDVLKHAERFSRLMGQGAIGAPDEWLAAHTVADDLVRKGNESDYDLFIELALGWIADMPRRDGANVSASVLAAWAGVWEKASRMVATAQAFNLDRKQVILNLFGLCFARNAG